jgi:phosphopantothenoylcysteine decarboxylase/phosphopantothenate--cysteine ligase
MRILITAGGTREYIDPVRFISNASSGKMGQALVRAAIRAGHEVTLITTIENPRFQISDFKLKIVYVESAAQMFNAVRQHFDKCDCLIMAAAVADYTPARPHKAKIKRGTKHLNIRLKPTKDILKWAGQNRRPGHGPRGTGQVIVGFALEEKDLRKRAESKLKQKNLDMVIANTPAAIGADRSTVQIKTRDAAWLKIENATKAAISKRVVGLIENL